ncbi:MAG: acyloxyacyl hydrolase [Actinomycetota bacterium]
MAARRLAAAVLTAALGAATASALAQPADGPMVLLGAGAMGLHDGETGRAEAEVQLRGAPLVWRIEPQGGLLVNDSGSVYGWAGIAADLPVWERLSLTPAFGAGLYGRGDGKDLGHTVEFRSQVELAWTTEDGLRIGVQAYHISNAGLGARNPGVEGALLVVGLPFGR